MRGSGAPAAGGGKEGKPIFFTGEMIYPWMFSDYSELRKVSEVAELVARDESWGPLWDLEQLGRNEVPVYAAAYEEDMYVDFGYARETAERIKGCRLFVTNVVYHDGIRSRMKEVVEQLFALKEDVID